MKNLNIFEVQGKIKFLGVGSRKKLDIGGLPKKGTWTVRTFNGGLGKKEQWWCLMGESYNPMHTVKKEI